MFVQVVQRSQIGEVLFGGRRMASLRQVSMEHPRELPSIDPLSIAAVWFRDPESSNDLPEVLVTTDGQERDWLAWLITFAPTLRPFTAFCRIMGITDFTDCFDAFKPPNLGRLENACIGLVLGEALSSEEVLLKVKETLTASACASVLSFALVRRLAIHRHAVSNERDLADRWARIRKITLQRERGLALSEVVGVSEVVGSLLHSNNNLLVINDSILHACQELSAGGELISSALAFGPSFEKLAHTMHGTREERVDLFEKALDMAMTSKPSAEESFTLGYLASRINPGTLAHASLLAPARQRHPAAMLWYGVCAGLSGECSILGEFGGVGRRVLRDLLATDDLATRPRTDISSNELEILLSGERADDFPVTSPSQLSIELDPGISTVVNWSSRARTRRMPEVMSPRPEDSAWIEQELGNTISRLVDIQRRVRNSGQHDGGPEQGSLYESRPTRRGSKQR